MITFHIIKTPGLFFSPQSGKFPFQKVQPDTHHDISFGMFYFKFGDFSAIQPQKSLVLEHLCSP